LHKEIKKTLKLDVPTRTVFIPVNLVESPGGLNEKVKGYLSELYGFGYIMQLTLND